MADFPDLNDDGKITRADVLKGRGVFKRGGKVKKVRKFDSGGSAYLKSMTGEAGLDDSKEYMNSSPLEKAKRLGLKPGSKDFRAVMNQMGGGSKKDLASLRSDIQSSARDLGEAAGMTPVGMGVRSIQKAKDMMPKSYDQEMGMKKGGVAKTVTKEMEYDYKTGKKSFKGTTQQRDAHAEKEGKKVAKHLAYDKSMGMKKGGKVSSASKRADGCAVRGKTRI